MRGKGLLARVNYAREHSAKLSLADSLALNLGEARGAAGLTQGELSGRAAISRATIAQIESGNGDPRLATLEALAGVLGVSVESLLRLR